MSEKRNKYKKRQARLNSSLVEIQQPSKAKEESKLTKWYQKNLGLYTLFAFFLGVILTIITLHYSDKQTSIAEESLSEQVKANQITKKTLTSDSLKNFKERILNLLANNSINESLKKEIVNNEIKDICTLINYNPSFINSFLSFLSIINTNNIIIPQLHLKNLTLNNLSLKNVVFQDLKFENINLDSVKFYNCTFLTAEFNVCTFENSDFYKCQLISPFFSNCNFSAWTTFSNLFENANFYNVDAVGAEFLSSQLTGSKFSGNLHSANFSNSDLRNTTFLNCVLDGANFTNSDLRASTFQHVSLVGPNPLAKMGNMKLTGVPLGERDTLRAEIDLTSGISKGSDTIGGITITNIHYDVGPIKATFKGAKMGNMKWDDRILEEGAIGNDIIIKDGSYGMKIKSGKENKRKK